MRVAIFDQPLIIGRTLMCCWSKLTVSCRVMRFEYMLQEKKSEKRSVYLGFYAVDPIAHFMLILCVNMYLFLEKGKKAMSIISCANRIPDR